MAPTPVEVGFDGDPPEHTNFSAADLNIVPAANRRKKLLLADMDSTMIAVECIDELADFAGKKAEVAAITTRAMAGELDFEGALRARVAMLKGVTRSDIATCHAERVMLNPGAHELISAMNAAGAMTALVSGGFTVFTEKVAAELGFQVQRANTLLFDGDTLSGEVGVPIVTSETKLEVLQSLSERHRHCRDHCDRGWSQRCKNGQSGRSRCRLQGQASPKGSS